MITIQFLAEWALRSSILILSGALLLWLARVKDPSIRLAAWTAMLCGSLAIPLLTAALPKMPLAVMRAAAATSIPAAESHVVVYESAPVHKVSRQEAAKRVDWPRAAVLLYVLVAGTFLLRLCAGLAMGRRLLRGSRATGRVTEGIEIRESDRVASPVTLGIAHSAIVLPVDWRQWESTKLEAVLAHERSHILRNDPAVQLFSAIHRALVWHSPLSWFLHRSIVRLAEEASDDAAVAAACDRASYAEILMAFMQRGVRGAGWHGVAMARYDRPDKRIHRILDGTALSRGVTRWSVAAILAFGSPLAYVVAAAHPQAKPAVAATTPAQAAATPARPGQSPTATAAPAQATTPRQSAAIRRYLIVSGDSISSNWAGSSVDEQALRAKFGRNFAWFRQGGNEYVVTDGGVLSELQRAMEEQTEVNRMQGQVNDLQAVVNDHQGDVNRAQQDVNKLQAAVGRRQHIIDELQSAKKDDELLKKLLAALEELKARQNGAANQEAVNREQAKVNEMQARINEEQGKVNEQQKKVNEQQQRVSAEYSRKLEEILDSAVRRHLTRPVN